VAAEAAAQVVDDLAQERHRLLGIMHVARAVLPLQDVAGLRHVSEQRVVARVLAVMGVEAPERPADRAPRADDRAIHVDRETRELQAGEVLAYEVAIERDEGREGLLRELAKPVAHCAARGQAGQAAEARDERIAGEITQMLQAPSADVEQRQDHQGQPRAAVITAQAREGLAQPRDHVDLPQIALQQLEAAVRSQRLGDELDRKITLDHSPQARYAHTHQRGLQCERECMAVLSLKSALGALLIQRFRSITSQLFAVGG
jgi:hypothetical protein